MSLKNDSDYNYANNDNTHQERRARRMALDALEQNSHESLATVWKDLPHRFRIDKEFVLQALRSNRALPPKSEFERSFPQSLRFDRDVVLAFTARSDFRELFNERHLYPPECLTKDKEVMMAYCTQIPRSLQECSEELCDDRDVVSAAIALDGLELQYASLRLQEDRDIVVQACQGDGKALEFCPPGPVRDGLVKDRNFMLSVLRQHGGPMLRLVPNNLKHDPELLLEALKHGMRFRYCPFEYQSDKAFLIKALAHRSELYIEFNPTTQQDVDLCKAAMVSESSTPLVHKRVLEISPQLIQERAVVLALCQRGEASLMKQVIIESEHAATFQDDEEIMLTAVQRNCKLFSYASARLKQNVAIIMAALDAESAADVLAAVGHEALRQAPQIVVRALQVYPRRHLRLLRTHVPADLWTTNREVCMAYIISAKRTLDVFEPQLQQDQQMALCVAAHAGADFGRVGEAFRNDLAFMTQAVELNGRVLRYASRELLRSEESLNLVVRAVANHPGALCTSAHAGGAASMMDFLRNEQANNQRFLPSVDSVLRHTEAKLELHQQFVQEFLRGICILTHDARYAPARRSPLRMLDRGVETSTALKQLIAEFLGVPIGRELRNLRVAHDNLIRQRQEQANAAANNNHNNNHNHNRNNAAAQRGDRPPDAMEDMLEDRRQLAMDRWARRRWHRDRAMVALRAARNGAAAAAAGGEDDNDEDDRQQREEDFARLMRDAMGAPPGMAGLAAAAVAAARPPRNDQGLHDAVEGEPGLPRRWLPPQVFDGQPAGAAALNANQQMQQQLQQREQAMEAELRGEANEARAMMAELLDADEEAEDDEMEDLHELLMMD